MNIIHRKSKLKISDISSKYNLKIKIKEEGPIFYTKKCDKLEKQPLSDLPST